MRVCVGMRACPFVYMCVCCFMCRMISESPEWRNLEAEAARINSLHLKTLLADPVRNESLLKCLKSSENEEICLDFSRSKLDSSVVEKLVALAQKAGLPKKIESMFSGAKINKTENRAVLHTALRGRGANLLVDGLDVQRSVDQVLAGIDEFSKSVRLGSRVGFSGKKLTNVLCIGIGGSFLGPEFAYEALRATAPCEGRVLRFLANVDPIDVGRAVEGLDPESTLVIIISKTFTTAETMLNAATVREWLLKHYGPGVSTESVVNAHFCAVSTALDKTRAFGISTVFGFWDWVGGRFSVCSAVGILPLALHFGFETCRKFLNGAHLMDEHFLNENFLEKNLPVMLGLLSVWNSSFLKIESNAILPYCQALVRFVAHVQQVDMESNGKRVTMDGEPVTFPTGQIVFGEPGTNGQHSFYQLLHQGRCRVSCDFIGFKTSAHPFSVASHPVSNHDELMANFFAQPDALAFGKTDLGGHKHFPGDRPSVSLLMPVCDAFHVGALLALYEHRTAVQSFVWNTNAFDQWGVELGKVLAKNVQAVLHSRESPTDSANQNLLLRRYL